MITITKDKIYRSPFSLKSTKPDSETVKEIETSEVICYLGQPVELGEDVTFRDIFDLVIFHKEFLNLLYSSEMGGLLIDDFVADYEKDVTIFHENQEYKLRLMWVSDVYEYEGEIDFVDYISLDAYGKIDKNIDKEEYGISIAFTSLAEIKDSAIFIDNTFEIQDSQTYEHELGAIFKANHKEMTLYQIISAIIREITFYGKPEERDAQRKELQIRSEEIERWIEEGTIDEHTKSWSEVQDELSEMIEENLEEDKTTFWDILYPKSKPTGKSSKDAIGSAILAISEGSGLSLEEQLQEAHDAEDYENAAKLKKLIDEREKKKNKNK